MVTKPTTIILSGVILASAMFCRICAANDSVDMKGETTQKYALIAESNRDVAVSAFNKGLFHERQGDFVQAIASYKQAIRLSPAVKESYNNLAAVYFELGMYSHAIDFYRRALTLDPRYEEAAINLAMSYYAVGRFEDAREMFEYAQGFSSLGRDARYFRGRTYVHLALYDMAIESFLSVLHDAPDFYPAHFDVACVYMVLNKFSAAREHFKRVLLLAPQHERKEDVVAALRMIKGLDLSKVDVRNSVR